MRDLLTYEERVFLEKHGLSPDDVYNTRGQPKETWYPLAKAAGKNFVLGARCAKAGHRLRTRSGHCIQCNTATITFQRRHSKSGFVYIAGSLKLRLIKVGGCVSLKLRTDRLVEGEYAGADDWELLKRERAPEFGRLEQRVHALLAPWSAAARYMNGAHEQVAREVYACGFKRAASALSQAMQELALPEEPLAVASNADRYNFEDATAG